MLDFLPFQRQIITELLDEDGLLVLARGLGLRKILAALLTIYAEPTNLVFLLNTGKEEQTALAAELACRGAKKPGLRVVNNETPSAERTELYKAGGVISTTSRIFVVDLLNKRVPLHLVTGILVNHAERVSDTSTEAFIIRIFREENNVGFVKAFTDSPESLCTGFSPLERTVKLLYLRKVFIWPRFQVTVKEDLETSKADVIELRQQLTPAMKDVQIAITDCMDACLSELRRASSMVVVEEMTVENALFKSFDVLVRRQLDPIWHKLGHRTKQLVGDMNTLRKLLSYMVSYDCVTFHSFLEAILASNSPNSSGTVGSATWQQSPWLFTDAGDTLVRVARERVYRGRSPDDSPPSDDMPGCPPETIPVLEEQPKWRLLLEILQEIERDLAGTSTTVASEGCVELDGPVLVMTKEERECFQIRELLSSANSADGEKDAGGIPGGQKMLRRLLVNQFRWKAGINQVRKNLFKPTAQSSSVHGSPAQGPSRGRVGKSRGGAPPASKRRRIRGGASAAGLPGVGGRAMAFEQEASEIASYISNAGRTTVVPCEMPSGPMDNFLDSDDHFQSIYGLLPSDRIVIVRSYTGEDDDAVLEEVQPKYIVLYDPDPAFIRRIEVFKALRPGYPLRVYFMIYADSVEEQKYLSNLRREKDSFERLIREKSVMAVRVDQDRALPASKDRPLQFENTRIAGGGIRRVLRECGPSQVIVDVREFRSSVPSLVHARGLRVVPCTLEVGDYVLSPSICVERKSVSDLVGSLNNGRLFAQAENMCLHYKTPVLLIEFDQGKSFSLQSLGDQKEDINLSDISSKIVLLVIAFPQLRIIWSSSPYETAEMFEMLKKSQDEPDAKTAMAVGMDNLNNVVSVYNITSQEMLRNLTGITSRNYRLVMNKVENIAELVRMSLDEIQAIIGEEPGKRLFDFINENVRDG